MKYIQTTLGALRAFHGWQDAGETGENPRLTDKTLVRCYEDGSVNLVADDGTLEGVIVDPANDDLDWLFFIDALAQREGAWE